MLGEFIIYTVFSATVYIITYCAGFFCVILLGRGMYMKLKDYEIKHNEIIRKNAAECTLFLKKDGSFPLSKACRIALFGNGARNTVRGGTGSGDVNSRFSVSIEKGLEEGGFTITSGKWLDSYDKMKQEKKHAWIKEMKKKGKGLRGIANIMGAVMKEPDYNLSLDYDADAAIYVLSRISGEGSDRTYDRGDFKLTETEVRDILSLNARFDRFLLVLNTGGVVDLEEVKNVKNILLFSQLGALGGNILSDIILGISYPSGKLSTTWASEYPNIGTFGDMDDTYYNEGIYVGYRYYDATGTKPLFPFGFGLSYTQFDIKPHEPVLKGTKVSVSVTVRNTGKFRGKEVVQLYTSSKAGFKSLSAFAKTKELEAGKTQRLTLSFDMESLASYNSEKQAYILEKGDYVLFVGNSSANTVPTGVLSLDKTVVVKSVKNLLGDSGFEDWAPKRIRKIRVPEEVKRISVSSKDFKGKSVRYDAKYKIDPFISSLTDEELCYINIGRFNKGPLSIIGNASKKVAGAAGDFTDTLVSRGFPQITLADGPAGLRLNRQYFIDKDGNAAGIGNDSLLIVKDFLPTYLFKIMSMMGKKPKKNQKIFEQFCSMIPVGTAVAQSFNTDLAKLFGDIVGTEMELFNVDIWLAPAMNIHRDIRCGRNFEYYSEDPLLTGKIAASVTKGVQSHSGRAVAIKHYAANNQENNRYGSNSHVSEKALRDIYLKGFEIAVKEAKPLCVMTSYNLLNGTHTSENRALVENVLRNEFGFKGIVMTDWIVGGMEAFGKYSSPTSCNIAMAGGDVMMPGSENDYKTLLEGLKNGKVSREQLEINASRMYNLAKKLSEEQS